MYKVVVILILTLKCFFLYIFLIVQFFYYNLQLQIRLADSELSTFIQCTKVTQIDVYYITFKIGIIFRQTLHNVNFK